MPSPPFNHGFGNDVFVSYTHADNEPDPNGRRWVSEFASDLKRRLAQVSGRSVAVWRDDRLGAADVFDREIRDQIARTAVLVPILSPSYLNSRPCRDERDAFAGAAREVSGPTVGNKARIVKVAKTPVVRATLPAELRDLLEHRFYADLPNGEARELLLHEDAAVRLRYAAKVDDVAREIAQILSMLESGVAPATPRGSVYLAETTSDLEDARDQVRRALQQRGYDVLPDRALPLQAPRLLEFVAAELSRCALSIHPMGAHVGLIPEQAGGKSIVRLQLESAALMGNRRTRIVWVPEGLVVAEPSQGEFLDEVRRQYPSLGFEVVEATVQTIETHLRDRLEAPARPAVREHAAGDGPPRVYVMCDTRDRDAARVVRKTLLARGFEVDFPPEAGEPAEVRELHQERLREDEAFVIFYGRSPDLWVQRQLGELRKAMGLGRRAPIRARRVFLAEPLTPDKEDLRADARLVLEGFPPVDPQDALGPLIADLTAASGRGRSAGGPDGPASGSGESL
jgi:hypothetical protein